MKYIITEQQFNDMIPTPIRRRVSDIDDTLYEWLYNTNVGKDVDKMGKHDYIVYVVELLFEHYYLDLEREMEHNEVENYIDVLFNLFANKIGNFWDNHHVEDF
jgi:hypothetical protein